MKGMLFDGYSFNFEQRSFWQGSHLHTGAGLRLTGESAGIDGVKALDKTK